MSFKEIDANLEEFPEKTNIDYRFTDIVINRPKDDVNKPIDEQKLKLFVRCVGTVEGAKNPLKGKQQAVTISIDELMKLNATNKTIVKRFVKLCEKAVCNNDQTFTEDFVLY